MAATFKLSVRHGDGEPQVIGEGLATGQVEQGLWAFARDMLGLPDSAVTKITIKQKAPS